MESTGRFRSYLQAISSAEPIRVHGKVAELIGLTIESTGPYASVGDVCIIERNGVVAGKAEVVGFKRTAHLCRWDRWREFTRDSR